MGVVGSLGVCVCVCVGVKKKIDTLELSECVELCGLGGPNRAAKAYNVDVFKITSATLQRGISK